MSFNHFMLISFINMKLSNPIITMHIILKKYFSKMLK